MKKVFLIAAIAAVSFGANAQVTFGAQAGANMGNVKSEFTYAGVTEEPDTKSKVGFLIGGVAEISLSENLTFRPELNFIQKGYKSDMTETFMGITYTEKEEVTMNFIELPLNVAYSFPAGAGTFFVGAGPSIGFGISGKNKWSSTETGEPNESGSVDIKFDGKDDATDAKLHLKALDFGANIMAGYKLASGLFFNLGYTMGFSNLSPYENTSLKTSGLALKIGYMFGGSAPKED